MAKIYGLFGAMTGKLADTVMAVRNGEQIARKYQPVVSNPATAGQVEARAKLKLMSQLSAIMAPVIAIPRQGSLSSRNLFTKVNFPLTTYTNSAADIEVAKVQLTKSVVALPSVIGSRDGNNATMQLSRSGADVDRVIYAVFINEDGGRLRYHSSSVVTSAGAAGNFPTEVNVGTTVPVTVLAYGVRDNTEAARAYFSNITVTAENIARVVTTRQLTETDITLTETQGAQISAQA